jgi:DNA-binding HxlR family transcriptional regulator
VIFCYTFGQDTGHNSGSNLMSNETENPCQQHDEASWQACSVFQRGSELLGRRWTGVIIYMLLQKPHRFNELLTAVHGISDRLLTERLRELEDNGLVERRVIPDSPVRVEYLLTEAGRDAHEIITATWRWSNKWLQVQPDE